MAKANAGTGTHSSLLHDLNKACEALEERYGSRKPQKFTDFIEALASQILELGAPEKASRDALTRLREEFVDWNDMRVASVREIQDILGAKFPKCRERAEDLKHLLADLYTAFRRMEINDLLNDQGIETLRALPDTTNIRRDMVDRALLLARDIKVFPCDEAQFRLLKFLGGVPKPWTMQQGVKKIEEVCEVELLVRLSRALREHTHVCQEAGEDEPQPIDFGLDKDEAKKDPKAKTTKIISKKK